MISCDEQNMQQENARYDPIISYIHEHVLKLEGVHVCTSAGFFHMNEFVSKGHDIRMILLACVSQEVEQRLLQISWFGVTELKQNI